MNLRVLVAGLLVGMVGLAGLAAAFAVEHHTVKQVHPFLAAHPEAFPVAPNTASLAMLGLTVWVGLLFAVVFSRAYPRGASFRAALEFG